MSVEKPVFFYVESYNIAVGNRGFLTIPDSEKARITSIIVSVDENGVIETQNSIYKPV